MRSFCYLAFSSTVVFTLLLVSSAWSQEQPGTIVGRVTDAAQGVLVGARVELQPTGQTTVSDQHGEFRIVALPPGHYTLKVSYVGFAPFSTDANVSSRESTTVDAVLQVGKVSEQVTVTAPRQFGELEALNRERTADNIVQVLPAQVITSLPNTNIADAVGRMPSVSLERDEGEGKYIQIRGTEPRLSNVTIDGIHVPGPEDVRNVKLDVIPADLVDSVEISKSLSADQDADAIGGSVNIVTKSATEKPYYSFGALGGYTPIANGRAENQFDGTFGQRFGATKRFGLMISGSYDHNSRGIDDLEPSQAVNTLSNGSTVLAPNSLDLRQYLFDRTRYGFAGGLDYKLSDESSLYLHGLFSKFTDFGEAFIYTQNVGTFLTPNSADNTGNMRFEDVHHLPEQRIFSLQGGGREFFGTTVVNYEVALSQARGFSDFPRAVFAGPSDVAFGINTDDPFTPKLPVLNGVNIFDPTTYGLTRVSFEHRTDFERDVVGSISLDKQYKAGSHYASLELGVKISDDRKTQLYNLSNFFPLSNNTTMASFPGSFANRHYYLGDYTFGPTTNYSNVLAYFHSNPGAFTGGFDPIGSFPNDFDITERIYAGYLMNTISLGRLRLQAGVRVESTHDSLLGNVVALDTNGNFLSASPFPVNNSYTNVFPSVQAQYGLGSDTDVRASYGMGIARPNFGDIAPFVVNDPTSFPPVSAGNPNLKPTHAQNFDLVVERYLQPVGLIQGGVFYKYLTNPIYTVTTTRTIAPFVGSLQSEPINGPRAHIGGVELSWQQQLRFLPGLLNGMGVRANYSYTTSRASFPVGFGRTDHPALIRQGPNNWNFDATYDKKRVSARMGLSHNDAYIWAYNFVDGAAGGIRGPDGDLYLYPHTQVDAQVSYTIPRGRGLRLVASFLNLTNEVFGFYNGSERFPVQREYYSPTYAFGLRWTKPYTSETKAGAGGQ